MKTIHHLSIVCLLFVFAMASRADQPKVASWEEHIDQILEKERDEDFYDQPGIGHLWGKVEVKGIKGVLICPEGGMGKAFLILKSGDVYERDATSHGVRLSYCPTINSMDSKAWNKFEMDKHWTARKRDGIALDFAAAAEKAWAER